MNNQNETSKVSAVKELSCIRDSRIKNLSRKLNIANISNI